MSIEDRVVQVIKKQLGTDEEISPLDFINDDLSADSLDRIEITMALEEEFEIEIPDSLIDDWVNVQNIIDDVTVLYNGVNC